MRLLLAALLLLVPALAAAQARPVNPCNFNSTDAPCRLSDGVYRALIPQGPGPHPAVIYLYGSLGLSKQVTDAAFFRREVVRRGYALIVPAALDVTYRGNIEGTGWGRRARAGEHPRDDLDFLRRVIRDAAVRHSIDRDRVIFAGQSDGAFMIWEIACHAPQMGAAFAVHAGSYGGPLPGRCTRPVRFLQAHGARDRTVPLDGISFGPVVAAAPVPEALDVMARTNRCARGPVEAGRAHGFARQVWEGCAEGASLEYLEHGGGHSWPPRWLRAVLDWFERTEFRAAEAVTRRVGDRPSGGRFRSPGEGGHFMSVPD
jgi:polyhydroxybutyrate depolymerase